MSVTENNFLRLISNGESLILDECDGSEILADKRIFTCICSDLRDWSDDVKATEEIPVDVYEMEKNATSSQMFGELNSDVRKLSFTQHQIKNFVKKYPNWLQTEGYTLFLLESNGQIFVIRVGFFYLGDLWVYIHEFGVNRFGYDCVWCAGDRHRIVVPKLA